MDSRGQFSPFSCKLPTLKESFDVLSGIAATGELVVSVELLDNGHYTPLPPEAFDGRPMASHIEKLEERWKAVLDKPVNLIAVHHRMLATCSQGLYKTYTARISWLECAINEMDSRRQQLPPTHYWKAYHLRLEMQLSQYRRQLQQAQAGQRRICERLATYLADE